MHRKVSAGYHASELTLPHVTQAPYYAREDGLIDSFIKTWHHSVGVHVGTMPEDRYVPHKQSHHCDDVLHFYFDFFFFFLPFNTLGLGFINSVGRVIA